MHTRCYASSAFHVTSRLAALALCVNAAGLHAQSVSNTGALSFGSFAAGSGGTVSVAANGARSKTGGVMLVGQGEVASPAQFVVTGTPNASFGLTLPADGTVVLSDGSHTMALGNFSSSPGPTGVLPVGGTQLVRVGARLTVGSSQISGSYSGAFSLVVNYE